MSQLHTVQIAMHTVQYFDQKMNLAEIICYDAYTWQNDVFKVLFAKFWSKTAKVKYIAEIAYEYDISKFSDDSFWPSMDYFFVGKLSFTDIICYATSKKSYSQFPGVFGIFGSF